MEPIAHIYTDFKTKFGLPRQSGLVEEITGKIVFQKEYSIAEAFKGLEDFMIIDTDDALVICPKDDKKFKEFISGIAMPEFEKYR